MAGAKSKEQVTREQIRDTARDRLGFEDLRPGQEEALLSILNGRDTLVVQPTGSGKSAIYQIAGLLINGPTVIVSPLIALQKDQLDAIRSKDLAEAAVVNSNQKVGDLRDTFEKLEEGKVEFVFLAPEQFAKEETRTRLEESKPSLFVIDEAHCISEWGHDFRPDYLRLGAVIEALGRPPVLAMTATASPLVRDEIVERLGMRDAQVIVKGFDRPNISLEVEQFDSEERKLQALYDAVQSEPKPGIVYASTRKNAEAIAEALAARNIRVVHYHGGMNAKDRERIQNAFMDGEADLIVATNAFGMGVDKANVRFVFHADISDSLDSYYQEVGRGGRDGEPARAVLFYRPENINLHKFLKGGGQVDAGQLQQVVEMVQQSEEPVEPGEVKKALGLSERKLNKAITRLEETGAIEVAAGGELVAGETNAGAVDSAREALHEQQRRREFDKERLEKMKEYAEILSCRREYLLQYFGDEPPLRCGNCDICGIRQPDAEDATSD
ncbi:MAG TPA: ATP-dependent DNA helicase RecQ [Bryobacteraceae bacterium]|nr:ATP-dependent DNA helicase RecQ [Bryobacteraceae bacterium]